MAVYWILGTIIAVLLPLLFDVYIYFDKKSGRVSFGIYLYGIVKLFGGFLVRYNKDFMLHYHNKRAKLFKRKDMGSLKVKTNDLKAFKVLKSKVVFSFPFDTNYCLQAAAVLCSTNCICPFIKAKNKFIDIKSTIIYGYESNTKIYFHLRFLTNILSTVIFFIKARFGNE